MAMVRVMASGGIKHKEQKQKRGNFLLTGLEQMEQIETSFSTNQLMA